MDGKLRFFMTSRNGHATRKKLENHNGITRLGTRVEEDIQGFVCHRLEKLSLLQEVLGRPNKSDLKERIIRDVPRYADGMFRYAALLLEELNEPSVNITKR